MQDLSRGAFAFDRWGGLHARAAGRRPTLRFEWRGRACEAELAEGGLRLGALAARIPSTAERAADRRGAFDALATLPHSLPPRWRVRLLPDHRIRIEAAGEPGGGGGVSAPALVAQLVRFALALDPYLDALESAGATAPVSTGAAPGVALGTAKT